MKIKLYLYNSHFLNLGTNFFGNPYSSSTPTDNDIAISDSGLIVSVINTNILVYNTKNSVASPIKSLAAFGVLNLNTNFRVLSFSNPFAETNTSYFHKSIGG